MEACHIVGCVTYTCMTLTVNSLSSADVFIVESADRFKIFFELTINLSPSVDTSMACQVCLSLSLCHWNASNLGTWYGANTLVQYLVYGGSRNEVEYLNVLVASEVFPVSHSMFSTCTVCFCLNYVKQTKASLVLIAF